MRISSKARIKILIVEGDSVNRNTYEMAGNDYRRCKKRSNVVTMQSHKRSLNLNNVIVRDSEKSYVASVSEGGIVKEREITRKGEWNAR